MNTVGGSAAGAANTIAFNGRGVRSGPARPARRLAQLHPLQHRPRHRPRHRPASPPTTPATPTPAPTTSRTSRCSTAATAGGGETDGPGHAQQRGLDRPTGSSSSPTRLRPVRQRRGQDLPRLHERHHRCRRRRRLQRHAHDRGDRRPRRSPRPPPTPAATPRSSRPARRSRRRLLPPPSPAPSSTTKTATASTKGRARGLPTGRSAPTPMRTKTAARRRRDHDRRLRHHRRTGRLLAHGRGRRLPRLRGLQAGWAQSVPPSRPRLQRDLRPGRRRPPALARSRRELDRQRLRQLPAERHPLHPRRLQTTSSRPLPPPTCASAATSRTSACSCSQSSRTSPSPGPRGRPLAGARKRRRRDPAGRLRAHQPHPPCRQGRQHRPGRQLRRLLHLRRAGRRADLARHQAQQHRQPLGIPGDGTTSGLDYEASASAREFESNNAPGGQRHAVVSADGLTVTFHTGQTPAPTRSGC